MKTTVNNYSVPLLHSVLGRLMRCEKDYVVLAIGSDRATGDCVGPLVGHFLTAANKHIPVFGGLLHPVTALNFEHVYTCMKLRYPQNKIIAVDSCLGKAEDVGSIKIDTVGIVPAAATGKKFRRVGDISITAIVADKKNDICTVRLGMVLSMAEAISAALADVLSGVTVTTILKKTADT